MDSSDAQNRKLAIAKRRLKVRNKALCNSTSRRDYKLSRHKAEHQSEYKGDGDAICVPCHITEQICRTLFPVQQFVVGVLKGETKAVSNTKVNETAINQ